MAADRDSQRDWVSCREHPTGCTASTNDYRSFRHIITEAKSPVLPSETGGGVLADEMGMGKSLSILSLITQTLENARMWAENGKERFPNEISISKRPSRATLVVVTSICECLGQNQPSQFE